MCNGYASDNPLIIDIMISTSHLMVPFIYFYLLHVHMVKFLSKLDSIYLTFLIYFPIIVSLCTFGAQDLLRIFILPCTIRYSLLCTLWNKCVILPFAAAVYLTSGFHFTQSLFSALFLFHETELNSDYTGKIFCMTLNIICIDESMLL